MVTSGARQRARHDKRLESNLGHVYLTRGTLSLDDHPNQRNVPSQFWTVLRSRGASYGTQGHTGIRDGVRKKCFHEVGILLFSYFRVI